MEKIVLLLAKELNIKPAQAEAALQLLDGGNTVPFIARYRKEATGSLDEEQIRTLEARAQYLRNLDQRREEILNSIREPAEETYPGPDCPGKGIGTLDQLHCAAGRHAQEPGRTGGAFYQC